MIQIVNKTCVLGWAIVKQRSLCEIQLKLFPPFSCAAAKYTGHCPSGEVSLEIPALNLGKSFQSLATSTWFRVSDLWITAF